ncbi:MAG: F0F1 ATP synthase subunit A [Thermoguttaceae bacterium]|nr:F0F1 ATP synthase subunit A [Thermoguttaceae bacterium]
MDIDIGEIGSHVSDANGFHLPQFFGHLPDLPKWTICGHEFQLTKFMVLEVVVAVLLIAFFFPLARRVRGGQLVKGRFWNMLEAFLTYLRNEVIIPSVGKSAASRYTPFLWTLFFFILGCNLMGMLPWCGSPTGNISVTAVLALITYLVVIGGGMLKQGLFKYWFHQVPKMDLPLALSIFLKPMIFVIEVAGNGIKHVVLAIRLLANMFAGHVVLAVFLAFISASAGGLLVLWIGVTSGSVLMSVALSCLELFVAFLQAYIFMFLAAIFIGMAQHQH